MNYTPSTEKEKEKEKPASHTVRVKGHDLSEPNGDDRVDSALNALLPFRLRRKRSGLDARGRDERREVLAETRIVGVVFGVAPYLGGCVRGWGNLWVRKRELWWLVADNGHVGGERG